MYSKDPLFNSQSNTRWRGEKSQALVIHLGNLWLQLELSSPIGKMRKVRWTNGSHTLVGETIIGMLVKLPVSGSHWGFQLHRGWCCLWALVLVQVTLPGSLTVWKWTWKNCSTLAKLIYWLLGLSPACPNLVILCKIRVHLRPQSQR